MRDLDENEIARQNAGTLGQHADEGGARSLASAKDAAT